MNEYPYGFLPEHLKMVGEIDEFKGRWNAIANLSPEQLSELKSVATIQSIGSSTRIEGSKLSDLEIKNLLSGLSLKRPRNRDEQEVAGYADAINLIFSSFNTLSLSEETIRNLHVRLMQFSAKDRKRAGKYKTEPNHIEAFDQEGKSLGIVFEAVSPEQTPAHMKDLVQCTNDELSANTLHPLLILSMFTVHFLAINPFDDGNGRLSRILTNLLLLKSGYRYVPYCSLEKIVEDNKDRYYIALNETQKTLFTDHANEHVWTSFFLSILRRQVGILDEKIRSENVLTDVPPLSRDILSIARTRGTVTVAAAVAATGTNRNTVKVHVRQLESRGLLVQKGHGKGTWYEPAAAE
ncbi:MAG TPA: Fic family protein [Kiritimatiellia bacterium]|nr:Fic family protein [Kiritimatiellia bacterium]